jgi:hypothetical protein
MSDYHIFLAVPNAGSIMPCALTGVAEATRKHKMSLCPMQFGDIPHNFNMMWCQALMQRRTDNITHFAMLHTDIKPSYAWLDTLLEEMDRVDADVMSTIIAIKDNRGLTTTGIRYPHVWGTRRFTMREIMRLPETFTIADTDEPDGILAINTGCWVCRLPAAGWPDKFPGFQNEHKIEWRGGEPCPEFDSEDWLFSAWAATQELKVYATRKVKAFHAGGFMFGNDTAWGSWETELQRPSKPLGSKLRNRADPQITVDTEKPVAFDSLDHTAPSGTARDNSVSHAFNRKLFQCIPADEVRLLDLGCAGGGVVRSILESGGFAIGIEGSDYSKMRRRAEWGFIPDYLFTADISEPFTVRNCTAGPVKFNVISAWEFLEHIAEEKLPVVIDNIKRHAEPGALFVGSISFRQEPHHANPQRKDWWIDRLGASGFRHDPEFEQHIGHDTVRGLLDPDQGSYLVAFRVDG